MNYPLMYVLSSVTDIALDISILSLPALFIWRLRMAPAKKISIIGIFGLGILYELFPSRPLYVSRPIVSELDMANRAHVAV